MALRSSLSVSLLLCWGFFPHTTRSFTTSAHPSSSDSSSSSIPAGNHCSAWVDRCTGEHHCTAGGNSTDPTPPSCYPPIPANLTPAPGICALVNESCQFVNPCKECYSLNTQCTNKSCSYQSSSAPPLKLTECLPINGSCQEYNPCRMWPGYCGGPYQCITDVQYYRYTHGPAPPICPIPIPPPPKPPGECIYLNGQCTWSNCTSWFHVCWGWQCTTQLVEQLERSHVIPCPPYPIPSSYAPQPGPCQYNITAGQCRYITDEAHPCKTAICPNGTRCEDSSGVALCQPSCSVDNGGCPLGDKCSIENESCSFQPCLLRVKCTPMDPCAGVDCAIGYRCMVDGASGTGYCEPSCDLYNGGCAGDQQCVLKQVECFTMPCPPVVECVQLQESPCQQWVDRCTGEHHCSAGGGNNTDPTPPSCYPPIPANLTPAPGVCTLLNGSCQFVNPCKECYSSNTQCTNKSCDYQSSSASSLKLTECLPINGTCQEYNPCRMWPGYCGRSFQCITDVQYYRYTHGPPTPICPLPNPPPPKPPGECIYLNGQCTWSNCTSWFHVCWGWQCTTQLVEQFERSRVIPCPPYPIPSSYVPQPGPCQYNITAGQCRYIADEAQPCETAICPNGTRCEDSSGIALCQPSCSVDNGGCPLGDKCSIENKSCSFQPCFLTVKCTPMDPCAGVDCAIGYQCMVDGASGTGYCEPSCDLHNGGCAADQQCVLKQVECFTTPCPPVVECVQLQESPCQQWVNRCTGEHHCTADGNSTTPPNCYTPIPADLTPAPGVCTLIDGSCQFVNPCTMWKEECYGTDYKCLMADKSHQNNCTFYIPAPPPPKAECVPINGTCREYNSCRIWEAFCGWPYECITDVLFYQYTHGPPPPVCPPRPWPPRSDPPGECIYQHGKCVWSNCTTFMDICGFNWNCGSHYDYLSLQSYPPPPCPAPMPGFTPPPQPGPCKYNMTSNKCNFFSDKIHPCNTAICPAGRECRVYAPSNTAYCQPSCDIDNGGCKLGQTCSLVNQTCDEQPCPPWVKCTPMDPCAGVDCAIGYRCMVDGASGTGYCEPSCDLYNGGCAGDQQCVLKQVECFTTPCPPVVECVQLQETLPCKQWVNQCTGEYHCTAGGNVDPTPPDCPIPIPIPMGVTPAPGLCMLLNGTCQFVNPCITWRECFGDYQCTDENKYHNESCPFYPPVPPPKEKCIPYGGTCIQYSPCIMWEDYCGGTYRCITDIQQYRFTQTPPPPCPPTPSPTPQPQAKPPGDCIYQQGKCAWSNCTSWFGLCYTWYCGTQYDMQMQPGLPPPPCPPIPNPVNYNYFPQPGLCMYNVSAGECSYITDPTDPCETAICPNQTVCKVDALTGRPYCQALCSINNGGCPAGDKCSLVNKSCINPCPLAVECTPMDPCAGVDCALGYWCMVDGASGTGYCEPSCDLYNGGCAGDQQCVLKQVECFTTPCPPVVECVQLQESPCQQWVNRCTGEHHCTAGGGNSTTPPSCYTPIPADLTPAPGVCTLIDGSCQFVNPCTMWKEECYGTNYKCLMADKSHQNNCTFYEPAPPPPKAECVPINGTCREYKSCRIWEGFCGGPYECITDVQYYQYTHEPLPPECPPPPWPPRSDPPGECIYQHGKCVWSNCTSFMYICDNFWTCASQYDYLSLMRYPPPPCPPPEPRFAPPPQPGPCKYNMTSNKCNFFGDKIHPCNTAICPAGSECRVYAPTNTAYCQPSCDIDNGGCEPGQKCSLVNQTCDEQPCPPWVECTPMDPCAGVDCAIGYQCMVDGASGTGYCEPSCDLYNGGCAGDQQCVLKQVECFTTPCPPVVECVQLQESPCQQWVNRCTGEHHCTAGGGNSTTPPNCYTPIPVDLTPAPGVCTLLNGSCQFVNPCSMWHKCFEDYQCTNEDKHHNDSCPYQPPVPPPKKECLPINGTCQEYNPCRMWPGYCEGPYQCLTDVLYYQNTHSPPPDCPPPPHPIPPPKPPGDCIYQHGKCIWSDCTSWFGYCDSWSCDTQYGMQMAMSIPPPPCPPIPNPVNYNYLPQPGLCLYNLTAGRCNYVTNSSHPCETAICPNQTVCKVDALTGRPYCQALCSINNGGCPVGDKCSLVNTSACITSPNPCPLVVKCTPMDPCAGVDCAIGYRCMVDGASGTGYCEPSCDLYNGGCAADQQCVLKQVECSTTPCPPVVECVQLQESQCQQWVNRCTGEHHCTAGGNSTPPNCTTPIPVDLTPAPGVCTFIDGSCQFVNPCIMWNTNVECYGTSYKCLMADKSHKDNCTFYEPAPPPPKAECIPINGTCREYNSCRIWEGFCGGPYQCVTDVQYYQYTHEPPPPMCPPPPWPPRSDPPGECIYQHGKCVWSNCTTFMDQCEYYWNCASQYDYQSILSYPPHTCPNPEPGYTPAPQPGPCKYNMTSHKCQYFGDKIHPCNTAICPAGRECRIYAPTNKAYCQPSCDIDNGGCKPGQKCSLFNVKCFDKPCPPQVNCTDPPGFTNDNLSKHPVLGGGGMYVVLILAAAVLVAVILMLAGRRIYHRRRMSSTLSVGSYAKLKTIISVEE